MNRRHKTLKKGIVILVRLAISDHSACLVDNKVISASVLRVMIYCVLLTLTKLSGNP